MTPNRRWNSVDIHRRTASHTRWTIPNKTAKTSAKLVILAANQTADTIFKAALSNRTHFAANLAISNITIVPFINPCDVAFTANRRSANFKKAFETGGQIAKA